MKNLVYLFLLAFAFNSCSHDDTNTSEEVLLPIASVEMPATITVDNLATMMITYNRPTDCHIFNGFYKTVDGSTYTVGISALKFKQQNCMPDDQSIYEIPLQWTPTSAGEYTFKFWKGDNSSGIPQFIEYQVVVE